MAHAAANYAAVPRARRADPQSSHAAAGQAALFGESHGNRILSAFRDPAGRRRTRTAAQIADDTGLTVVQVDRRLPELKAGGWVRVQQHDGRDVTVGGYRVWELA